MSGSNTFLFSIWLFYSGVENQTICYKYITLNDSRDQGQQSADAEWDENAVFMFDNIYST